MSTQDIHVDDSAESHPLIAPANDRSSIDSITPEDTSNNDNSSPNNEDGHDEDPASCGPQPEVIASSSSGPCIVASGNKGFTTVYGNVLWPTLPGLSTAAAAGAPAVDPPAVGVVPVVRFPSDTNGGDKRERLPLSGVVATSDGRPRVSDVWSEKSARRGRTREQIAADGAGFDDLQGLQGLLRSACDACHRMKRRCDGRQPCTRCDRRNRDCTYSYRQKSGPPKGSKRKLLEDEDDLLENRTFKPPRVPLAVWSGDDEIDVVDIKPYVELTPAGSANTATGGPSPEALAAAAAAVAASRINALVPAAGLPAGGINPRYMKGERSTLAGVISSTAHTAAMTTHPRYGTVYQSYPPEVYALYLAELRQRGTNMPTSDENRVSVELKSDPASVCPAVGVVNAPTPLLNGPEPTANTAASATVGEVAVDYVEANGTATGGHELSSGSRLLSEAVNWVEHTTGAPATTRRVSRSSNRGTTYDTSSSTGAENTKAKVEGDSATAAVANSIAKRTPTSAPSSGTDACWSALNVSGVAPPTKDSHIDAPIATGDVMPDVAVRPEEQLSYISCATQREREAAVGMLMHGNNCTVATATANHVYGKSQDHETYHERLRAEGSFRTVGINETSKGKVAVL